MMARQWTYAVLAAFLLSLILPAPAQAQNKDNLSWYQCKLAGEITNINISGTGQNAKADITLDIKIAVFQHGFRALRKCPFKKGERITFSNYIDSKEAATLKTEGRSLERGFNMGKYDLNAIEDGDLATLLYGYYYEYGNEREVWNFLRVRRK